MKRISSPFPAFCHEYLKIKTFGVTILGKRNLKCNRFMSQDPNPAKNMDIHGMCMVIISGKSGRGEKVELGDFWMGPKDAGRIKNPFFSLLWECSNYARWKFGFFQISLLQLQILVLLPILQLFCSS